MLLCQTSKGRITEITFNNPKLNNKIIFHQKLENTKIIIYHTLGQVVIKKSNPTGTKFQLSDHKSGIYFIKLKKMDKHKLKK